MISFADLLRWDRYLTPSVVRLLYSLLAIVSVLLGLAGAIDAIMAVTTDPLGSLVGLAIAIFGAAAGVIGARVITEFLLIVYRIDESLAELRPSLVPEDDGAEPAPPVEPVVARREVVEPVEPELRAAGRSAAITTRRAVLDPPEPEALQQPAASPVAAPRRRWVTPVPPVEPSVREPRQPVADEPDIILPSPLRASSAASDAGADRSLRTTTPVRPPRRVIPPVAEVALAVAPEARSSPPEPLKPAIEETPRATPAIAKPEDPAPRPAAPATLPSRESLLAARASLRAERTLPSEGNGAARTGPVEPAETKPAPSASLPTPPAAEAKPTVEPAEAPPVVVRVEAEANEAPAPEPAAKSAS